MKSPPVCIDTNVCIYGIKKQANPANDREAEKQKIARAQKLFENLTKEEAPVWIPAIVLAELLVHEVGSPQFDALHADISSRFHILVFNSLCAKRHSEMLRTLLDDTEIARLRAMDQRFTRAKLKIDLQIVSTMLGHNVRVLYTEDPGLSEVATKMGIKANRLPPFEPTLFG